MRSLHRLIRYVDSRTLSGLLEGRSVIMDDRHCYEAMQHQERVRPGAASQCV
jgi:hypothetical protein